MKNLKISLVCFLIISCSEKRTSENQDYSNLTFSLDTVMVDPGDDFLYLRDNLWLSNISTDGTYLYNFNRNDAVLEKIDLDNLTLVNKIQFEKEGPNGIGTFISNFSGTSEGHIMMWSYGLSSIFDQNAKLIKNLNFDKIAEVELKQSGAYPMELFECPNDPNRFLGLFLQWQERKYFLLDVDTKNETYRKIELPELDKMDAYSAELTYDGQFVGAMGTGAFGMGTEDKIVVTNLVYNEGYIYDFSADSLIFKSWDGPLTGVKKTYLPPKQIEMQSTQQWEVSKLIDEDINYGSMLWDYENQRYLRLSVKQKFGEEKLESGAFKPIGAEIFLSIFDKDFNLVAESLVPDLNKRPDKHFVKDGQIWIFENIDDELAFLRLKVE
jgi:hypothetical protein